MTIKHSLSINKSFRPVDHYKDSYSYFCINDLIQLSNIPKFAHFKIWLNKMQEIIFTVVGQRKTFILKVNYMKSHHYM